MEQKGAKRKMSKKAKKALMYAGFAILVGASIFYAIYNDVSQADANTFADTINVFKTNWTNLLMAIGAFVLFLINKGLILSYLMVINKQKANFLLCLQNSITGKFYDYVTPLGTGGQPFQIIHFHKNGVDDSVSGTVPIAEYAMYRFAYIFLSIVAIVLNIFNVFDTRAQISTVVLALSIFGLICTAIPPTLMLLFFVWPTFTGKVLRFAMKVGEKIKIVRNSEQKYEHYQDVLKSNSNSMKRVFSRKRNVVPILILEMLQTVFMCLIAFFTLRAFGFISGRGYAFDCMQICVYCMFLYNAITFIPTPGNAGAADFTFYWLFHSILASGASAAMMIWRLFCFYNFFIAFFFMKIFIALYRRHKTRVLLASSHGPIDIDETNKDEQNE